MAIFTGLGRRNMARIFPGRYDPIVAELTVSSDTRMIEYSILPGVGAVTIITDVTTLDMARILALCYDTIVTVLALSINCKMIHSGYIIPVSRLMTKFTIFCAVDMTRRGGACLYAPGV